MCHADDGGTSFYLILRVVCSQRFASLKNDSRKNSFGRWCGIGDTNDEVVGTAQVRRAARLVLALAMDLNLEATFGEPALAWIARVKRRQINRKGFMRGYGNKMTEISLGMRGEHDPATREVQTNRRPCEAETVSISAKLLAEPAKQAHSETGLQRRRNVKVSSRRWNEQCARQGRQISPASVHHMRLKRLNK